MSDKRSFAGRGAAECASWDFQRGLQASQAWSGRQRASLPEGGGVELLL